MELIKCEIYYQGTRFELKVHFQEHVKPELFLLSLDSRDNGNRRRELNTKMVEIPLQF